MVQFSDVAPIMLALLNAATKIAGAKGKTDNKMPETQKGLII